MVPLESMERSSEYLESLPDPVDTRPVTADDDSGRRVRSVSPLPWRSMRTPALRQSFHHSGGCPFSCPPAVDLGSNLPPRDDYFVAHRWRPRHVVH